jgi:membrane-bound serine protease (ClpP class)
MKKSTLIKIMLVVLGLAGIFVMDDLLMLILVKELRIWQLSYGLMVVIGIILLGLNLSLALVVYRALRKRPATGAEGMIGKTGKVVRVAGNRVQVKVAGEIWEAESEKPVRIGDRVTVTELQGLVLKVRGNTSPAARKRKTNTL